MVVTNEAIGQGVVLASILSGFAFAIATQIALTPDRSTKLQSIALVFLISGSLGLASIVFGMLTLMTQGNAERLSTNVTYFFIALLFSAWMLIVGVSTIIDMSFDHTGIKRVAYVFIFGISLFVCYQIVANASPRP